MSSKNDVINTPAANATPQNEPSLDKWDRITAVSSGALTALLDIFWVGEFSLLDARKWGVEKTESFVIMVANSDYVKNIARKAGARGLGACDITQSIVRLQDTFRHTIDKNTNKFGSGRQHHLRDFAHHPTIIGLVFSLLTQFTGRGFGTDKHGNFICPEIENKELIGKNTSEKLFNGTVTWLFHLISDMAGSSSSALEGKEGTGIPGPLLSLLKQLSSIPGVKALAGVNEKGQYKFSLMCSKLFNGTLLGQHDENGNPILGGELRFDLRTEMGITYEIGRQALPVACNECIARAVYTVRRLCFEIKEYDVRCLADFGRIDASRVLPRNSKALNRMTTYASASFTVIDISEAGINAAIKCGGDKAVFAVEFVKRINYCGVGRLALAVGKETASEFEPFMDKYMALAGEQLAKIKALGVSIGETAAMLNSVSAVTRIATPYGYVSVAIDVYKQMSEAVKEREAAREERLRIEAECVRHIAVIRENRDELERAVSEYMTQNLTVFSEAFDEMDAAVRDNDSDGFIGGSAKIQKQLGAEAMFENQSEFDALMNDDDSFKM